MTASLDTIEQLSGIGSFTVDSATGAVWWSTNLHVLLGLDDVAPSLEALYGALTPIDATHAQRHLEDATADAAPRRYRTRDARILAIRVQIERDPAGRPTRRIAVVSDETPWEDLQQRLLTKSTILERAQAIFHVGSWTWNLHTDLTTWSPEMYEILGLDPTTPPSSTPLMSLVHPDDRDRVYGSRARAQRTGQSEDIEARIVRPDGQVRTVVMRGQTANDIENTMIGVVHDVTEEREIQRRLRTQDRIDTVGRLASGIAHDFNNLLTVINANVQMLVEAEPSPELEDILFAVARAAKLTQQLGQLDLSQDEPEMVVDVGQVLSEMLPALRHELRHEDRATALHTDLRPGSLIEVRFGGLERALIQVARNAREAGATNLWLTNRDVTIGGIDYAEIHVSDDGDGMPPEVLARATEAFFTTRGPRSTGGIGLTIMRDTVERAGGALVITSTVGSGTEVRVRWPSRRAESTAQDPSVDVVLVIEDDPSVRRVIRRILERSGRHVLEAADPDEAQTYMLRPITLILSDVVMPRGGGRRVSELRERLCPEVPLIYMSGYAGDAPWLGDHPFVSKPFSLDDFEHLLAERMRRRPDGG